MAEAMAECVLPEEMMLCILTRLPVKSLLRFKCVCKAWRELFATPKFIKMHHDQFSSDPKNQAFIIYSLAHIYVHTMSLLSIESNAKKPTHLNFSFSSPMYLVGCYNGLLCCFLPADSVISLWNPASRLGKSFLLPKVDFGAGVSVKVSIGFGYDAKSDEFVVVRLQCLQGKKTEVMVDVCSPDSNSVNTFTLPFQFRGVRLRNDVIVNGNPYWVAKVDKNDAIVNGHPYWIEKVGENDEESEVLVCCDVTKSQFNMVPLSPLKVEEGAEVRFADWEGCFAALVCAENKDRVESIDVWVFDDGEKIWRKNHTFKVLQMNVDKCLQCWKNWIVMGNWMDGKLFVFDPKTGWVKEIEFNEGSFEIYGYSESLAYVKGMKQLEAINKKEEEEEEGK